MAGKQKTYEAGAVYLSVAGASRLQLELVNTGVEKHVVTVTEGGGNYGERGVDISVAEDPSAAGFTAKLSDDQARELFDFLAEVLHIDYTGINDAE